MQAATSHRGRALWSAVPVLGVVAAVAVTLILRHGGSGQQRVFSPAGHQVTYEIAGTGTAVEIRYSVGTSDPTVLHKVALPWQTTVNVTAGAGGDVVNLESTNPGSLRTAPTVAAPLICRIVVDGQMTAQRTSTDGYADTACSANLYAQRG
jgi:hypothetical protein